MSMAFENGHSRHSRVIHLHGKACRCEHFGMSCKLLCEIYEIESGMPKHEKIAWEATAHIDSVLLWYNNLILSNATNAYCTTPPSRRIHMNNWFIQMFSVRVPVVFQYALPLHTGFSRWNLEVPMPFNFRCFHAALWRMLLWVSRTVTAFQTSLGLLGVRHWTRNDVFDIFRYCVGPGTMLPMWSVIESRWFGMIQKHASFRHWPYYSRTPTDAYSIVDSFSMHLSGVSFEVCF